MNDNSLHAVLADLDPQFMTYLLHSELRLGRDSVRFPHAQTGLLVEPGAWLGAKHRNGRVHEPGMIAWLFWLGGLLAGKQVCFVDIGAGFGYFSALASVAFGQVEIIAVEPQPERAGYCRLLMRANALASACVHAIALSHGSGERRLVRQRGTLVEPDAASAGHDETVTVETAALEAVLPPSGGMVDILKIDTEGWQAHFLPPAASILAKRAAVILLELDSIEKMAAFGTTNASVVRPFLAAGYSLYWCEHRNPEFTVRRLAELGPEHERNSLAVLLPPGFAEP